MPELSERYFCDSLEMKATSLSHGSQQGGAPETAAKGVISCFYLRLVIASG